MAKRHLEQYDSEGHLLEIYLNSGEVRHDGQPLDEALEQMQHDIEEASEGGGGEGTVTGVLVGDVTYDPDPETGIVDLSEPIGNKVDKIHGKGLSTNDYTNEEKTKLAGLSNYNDAELRQQITRLQSALDNLMNGESVTETIDTFNEVTAFLNGINTNDKTLANQLLALNNTITALQNTLSSKANAAEVYSKSETNAAIQEAVEGIEAGETVIINSDGANIIDEHDNNSVLLAPSARQMKLMYNNIMAIYNGLANIAFTNGKPTLDWVGSKTKYTLAYGTLTGCTADVAAGQVNEGALRIKLTPTQASYAFTSVTVNGESASTTATGDADGSVYLDIVVSGNITIAATAISGRGIDFTGSTGCSIGAAGVAIGQDLDTTITANEHYTLPQSISVKIGNTNVTHTYTRAQDNKTATLHIDAANITGDLTITCAAVEDAHVTLAISGSNFVVKQGSTELANGSKVYNGSAAQTLTIEPASGCKFSTLPSADKGTMTNNGPYAASSLEIGTSVSGTLTITAAGSALDTFSIDLSGVTSDVGVTWNTPSAAVQTILEGSPFSVTLAKVSGTGVLNISTSTMGSETLVPNNGTIATDHVTGDITIAASVAAARMKVHSYNYPATSDSLGDCLVDDEGGFNLYKYNSETASTFANGNPGNNVNAAFQSGWFGNGKSGYLRKSGSEGTVDIQNDNDFTLIFKDWKLSYNGNTAYNENQLRIPFFDEDSTLINEATNTVGRFYITVQNYSGSPVYINSGNFGFPRIFYISNGVQNKTFASSNSSSLGGFADTQGVAHDVIIAYNSSTKKATAWVAKVINGTKTLKLTGEISVAELDINCIQMPSSNTLISGLDIYNYAMTEQEAATATNSVIS